MGESSEKSKILVFGATGYLGKYIVDASLSLGHPTFVYTRPTSDPAKLDQQKKLESKGITIIQGELGDHAKLLSAVRSVDVVISTLADSQYLQQQNIIDAMKEAGNIKRFLPSEYGNDVDKSSALPPFQTLLDLKKQVRRATEAAGIPHTYVSANALASYFVEYLLRPHDSSCNEVTIYGTGETKAVWNYEVDIAVYTVKAATDPRACNTSLVVRPPNNIISQSELVTLWEKKSGRTLKRTYLPGEALVDLTEKLPFPDNVPVAIFHNMFIKGEQVSFEITDDVVEASRLFPDYEYTPIDKLLDKYAASCSESE